MEWQQLLSDKRFGQENRLVVDTPSRRSSFERDYDRLVFSPPFRRLQNKTQVFPLPTNIFVHNRLTHSLEVSCVGRSFGSMVGAVLAERYPKVKNLNFSTALSEIVSAACLAHDMGNPPFGHSGERAIGAYFREGNGRKWQKAVVDEGGRWSDFLNFEGNANAFRLLTHQFKGRREGGFALTYATLASIVKYPFSSEISNKHAKFGFFQSEEEDMRRLADELGLTKRSNQPLAYARYPLVYLVEAADDICYQVMDIEDAYKLRILSYEEAMELFMSFFTEDERSSLTSALSGVSDKNEHIAYMRSKLINLLVEETVEIFLANETEILRGAYNTPLLKELSPNKLTAFAECSQIAVERIYRSKEVIDVELAGHRIFTFLLDKLLEALDKPDYLYSQALLGRVSSQYDTKQKTTYGRIQCALDFISGMTDVYALDLYRSITGMNLPAI